MMNTPVWRRRIVAIVGGFAMALMMAPGHAQQFGERIATGPFPCVYVLGIAQDGGYPQAGCQKACCEPAWQDTRRARYVVSLAVIDPETNGRWLIECTPDFKQQLRALDEQAPAPDGLGLRGIFLTHAHIGHYAGLVHLGREVVGARSVPVYVMPRMEQFLRTSGPWSQLVELGNIELRPLAAETPVALTDRLTVTPIVVPHRGEYSETVAFRLQGPRRSILFLPDIDKWERWERRIEDELNRVDVAYLDATFFDGEELPGRDMAEIPHPFVVETLQRFQPLDAATRAKIRLIHVNHSNPLLQEQSTAAETVRRAGIGVARQLELVEL